MIFFAQTAFFLSAAFSLSFFFIKTYRTWTSFHTLTDGIESNRSKESLKRLQYLFVGEF